MKETLTIDENYYKLAQNLYKAFEQNLSKKKLIIGISGESGSGKSTTAICLKSVIEKNNNKVSFLQMDDYFHLPPASNYQNRLKDIANIGPQEVNLELLQSHLSEFLADNTIEGPESDFANNKFGTRPLAFEGASVLIIEGTYIPLLADLDILVFIDIDYKSSLENRISRGREAFDSFVEKVLDIEHHIIKKFKPKANIIIDSNYKIEKSYV
jgi:uridine kinase